MVHTLHRVQTLTECSGCSTHATCDVTFIEDAVYGCGGVWQHEGVMNGAWICASGYSICDNYTYAFELGLTYNICMSSDIFPSNNHYYVTLESSDGSLSCTTQGTNDVFGCASIIGPDDGWLYLDADAIDCGPFGAQMSTLSVGSNRAWVYGWEVDDPDNEFTQLRHEYDQKCNDADDCIRTSNTTGGVMCCKDANVTERPTSISTSIPTLIPTSIPSNSTEMYINYNTTTAITTSTEMEATTRDVRLINKYETISQYILFGILGVGLVTLILLNLYQLLKNASCDTVAKGDQSGIFLCFQRIADFVSDICFAIILNLEKETILFYAAITFTIIPYIVSCGVGLYWMERWRNRQNRTGRLNQYMKKYDSLFAILVVTCGFYSTVNFLRSKLFYMQAFNLPLKRKEYFVLQHYKFLNIVLLENIPQCIIQILYITGFSFNSNDNDVNQRSIAPLVFFSMVLSFLSILMLIFSESSRICQILRPQRTKYITEIVIEFCLTIKSPKLKPHHAFADQKIENCFLDVFNQIPETGAYDNASDVSVDIECYYINSSIQTFNSMKAYFTMTILGYNDAIKDSFCDIIRDIGNQTKQSNRHLNIALKSMLGIRNCRRMELSVGDLSVQTTHLSISRKTSPIDAINIIINSRTSPVNENPNRLSCDQQ